VISKEGNIDQQHQWNLWTVVCYLKFQAPLITEVSLHIQ
jgi:hypothetical protein